MNIQESLAALDLLQRKMAAYGHAIGLIYYDGATYAPSGTAANRGESMAILGQASYELSTCAETEKLLDELWANKDQLTEAQERMVFLLRKSLVELRKIPMEEYIAYQRLTNEAEDVWHRAKNDNDYAAFAPYIDKIVEYKKRFAGYVKPGEDPYEVHAYGTHKMLPMLTYDDSTISIMKFPGNVMGKVFVSTGCKRGYTMRTCVYGTNGTLIFDNKSPTMTFFEVNSEGVTEEHTIEIDVNNHNAADEFHAFADCIINDTPVAMNVYEGAKTVAACLAIVESSEKDGEVINPNYDFA